MSKFHCTSQKESGHILPLCDYTHGNGSVLVPVKLSGSLDSWKPLVVELGAGFSVRNVLHVSESYEVTVKYSVYYG